MIKYEVALKKKGRLKTMSDCIFCKIINGEIPSQKVYENDHVYAFLDISPVTKGHTLVIPKVHKENVFELSEEEAANLFKEVPKIANAVKKAFNPIGLNTINNNGEHAGQSVFHFHMHIIPRYGKGDGFGAVWKTHEESSDELKQIAGEIKNNI
ncbi:HIT family protein [Bacillus sp. B15-48]|uniref:HIT family protein n=1 Tax=Bacillus sp. B15-48 TaxID=1548601 RepID=UPI00193F11FE|nr:HIT family protein [Bacillus sp. B15-48]MBM4764170.1 HIT domain-containing protein [Bacillus sp. B15-48]